MRILRYCRPFLAAIVLLALVIGQETWALAGTTGGVAGVVTDDKHAPVAGARVTATSPSQTASTTTDNGGHYIFVSLVPDTYTLAVEKDGYDPVSLGGISIFADQTIQQPLQAHQTLKTIARVVSRAAGDLVKAGSTTDVYSVSAAQQQATVALGGGGSLNQAYSGLASVPGVYIPQGQQGWAQSVYIRGGNYTSLGYEFDGVPTQRAFDAYPGGTLSILGQQELQVYTGSGPASAQSTGLAGFINQVIKSGTYPGFGTIELGVGAPAYYHKAQFEAGGAAPNRNFSYYAGFAGYNQEFRYGSQFNGDALNAIGGQIYNIVAANCGTASATAGCYANAVVPGPYGYSFLPFTTNFNAANLGREGLVNLHVGIPHKKDSGRDDIQLLVNTSLNRGYFNSSVQDYSAVLPFVLSGSALYNGVVYPNCATGATDCALVGPVTNQYVDESRFTGAMGVPLRAADLGSVSQYFQPNSPTNRAVAGPQPIGDRDSQDIRSTIVKAQFQKNFGSNAYLRLYGYTFYTDWLNGNATFSLQESNNNGGLTGFNSPDYELISHERGAALNFSDQLNAQHLLSFTAAYNEATTVRWNNGFYSAASSRYPRTVAVLVDSANPTNGLCYGMVGGVPTPTYCGSRAVAGYRLPAIGQPASIGLTTLHAGDPSVTSASALTCGAGPCEYFTVENGTGGAYNNVRPQFSQMSLQDSFRPNEKWLIDLAAKYERFRYNLTDTTVPTGPLPSAPSAAARLLFQNSYNAFTCASAPAIQTATPFSCAAGDQAQFSVKSPSFFEYTYVSPRLGATYTLNPQNVLRFSAGLYVQPVSTAYVQYNYTQNNIAGAFAPLFYSQGYHQPARDVRPEKSENYDFSWEHQVGGSDVQWKITPFYRHTKDEINQVLLDPLTQFVSAVNVGEKKVTGIEVLLRKGDFNRDGLSGQLAYTYTHGTIRFKPLPSGSTALQGINTSVETYNAYTSFCAGHAADARCGSTTSGTTAAPCYTSAGAPDAACAPGSIANPYWNAPVQPLFDESGWYTPYNQLPGTGLGGVSSSYIIPHVATLVLNYKRNRFTITPTLQLAAGGKYGAPVNGIGIDPAAGCAPLAGAGITGDPRYPYGAAGGAPYDAQTCASGFTAPDAFTGKFDNFGAFTEPSQLAANVQIAYEASKNVTLRLNAINVYTKCFGGSNVPWKIGGPAGCWYGSPLFYSGNGYNPGNPFDYVVQFPYSASVGNIFQSAYGGQANPFNAFLSVDVKL